MFTAQEPAPSEGWGDKRWTLKLTETAVVELSIVDRASDNTIGAVSVLDDLQQIVALLGGEWLSPSRQE